MNEESNVELDEIYKVTSGEARIGLAANNQAQVCVLQRNFSRRTVQIHSCVRLANSVGRASESKSKGRGFRSSGDLFFITIVLLYL